MNEFFSVFTFKSFLIKGNCCEVKIIAFDCSPRRRANPPATLSEILDQM